MCYVHSKLYGASRWVGDLVNICTSAHPKGDLAKHITPAWKWCPG